MKALKNKIKVEEITVKDDEGNFVKGDEKSAEMIIEYQRNLPEYDKGVSTNDNASNVQRD